MTTYLMAVHGPVENEGFGTYESEAAMLDAFAATAVFNDKLTARISRPRRSSVASG